MAVPESSLVYHYLNPITLHIIKLENAPSSFCKSKDHTIPTAKTDNWKSRHGSTKPFSINILPIISKNFLNTLCSISMYKKMWNTSVSQNVKSPQKFPLRRFNQTWTILIMAAVLVMTASHCINKMWLLQQHHPGAMYDKPRNGLKGRGFAGVASTNKIPLNWHINCQYLNTSPWNTFPSLPTPPSPWTPCLATGLLMDDNHPQKYWPGTLTDDNVP